MAIAASGTTQQKHRGKPAGGDASNQLALSALVSVIMLIELELGEAN